MSNIVQGKRFVVGFPYIANWTLVNFKSDLPKSRICALCGVVNTHMHFIPCSHWFCDLCYKKSQHASQGTIVCPIDKKKCRQDQVRAIKEAAKELKNEVVSCKNPNCKYEPRLSEYERHIAHCEHQFVLCQLCSKRVVIGQIIDHVKNGCTSKSQENNSCAHSVRCELVNKELQVLRSIIQDELVTIRETIKTSIADTDRTDSYQYSLNLNETKQQDQGDKGELPEDSGFIFAPITQELSNFIYTWKIHNFTKHYTDAVNGNQNHFNSNLFYSDGSQGYCIYLRGSLTTSDWYTEEPCLSLYFVINSGPYDDMLEWPYNRVTSLTLMSQTDVPGQFSIEGKIDPGKEAEEFLPSFQKPLPGQENEPFGYIQFISIEDLVNPTYGYLKNDTLLVSFCAH